MLSIEELEKRGYKLRHTALSLGYQKKGSLTFERYSGRYGKGYKVYAHYPDSSNYKIVYYYTKRKGERKK